MGARSAGLLNRAIRVMRRRKAHAVFQPVGKGGFRASEGIGILLLSDNSRSRAAASLVECFWPNSTAAVGGSVFVDRKADKPTGPMAID